MSKIAPISETESAVVGERVDRMQERMVAYGQNARAKSTLATYASNLRVYEAWCRVNELLAFPAARGTIPMFLAAQADDGRKASTIKSRKNTILIEHRRRGYGDANTEPVKDVSSGVRRTHGSEETAKLALTGPEITRLLEAMPDDVRGWRDKAMIAIGQAGAMRRSELCAIEMSWCKFKSTHLDIKLPFSKTDQEGKGERIKIDRIAGDATCPVLALETYLQLSRIASGPLFRHIDRHGNIKDRAMTGRAFCRIVQAHIAKTLGKDSTQYGAHSLRASFATTMYDGGFDLMDIKKRGRWKRTETAERYIQTRSFEKDLGNALRGRSQPTQGN